MIGQENLLNAVFSYQTLPHSILLLGKEGCGKHTVAQLLAKKHILEYKEITDVSYESISEISLCPMPTLYLFNLNDMMEKNQNALLKLVEEPSKSVYIILIAESKQLVLNTIVNRCLVFNFQEYTREQLKEYIDLKLKDFIVMKDDVEYALKICDTPGQLSSIETNPSKLRDLFNMCEKIITKINLASYSNTMSIVDKCNYKDNFDKYNVKMFIRALSNTCYEHIIENTNVADSIKYCEMYEIINAHYNRLQKDSRLNKEYLISSMMSKLWGVCRNG